MRMRVSSRRVLPSAAAALLVLALGIESSRAAEDPPDEQEIQGRGFAPGKLYQFENIDTINAFSGNLNLTIPLGGRYSVGGPLEYGFTLSYNAAAWTYFFQANGSCNNPDEELWIQGVPTPTANSGLGWMVSWGYLVPPGHPILNNSGSFLAGWLWISSDGGHHYTWKTPHEEDADSDPSEWFTRDGTYARLQLDAGGSGIHELELPDGTIQTFEVGVHDNTIWEVTQMRDPFGNSVTIDRTAPDTNHWTVSDDQGRQHFIVFDDEPCDGFPCDLPRPRIQDITLAGFGGAPATYSFEYGVRQVDRGCRDTCIVGTNDDVRVPLLVAVTVPSGEQYTFGTAASPDYHMFCDGETGPTGRLRSVTLPTKGKIAWEWGTFATPRDRIPDGGIGHCIGNTKDAAVKERKLLAPDGSVEGMTWKYDNGIYPDITGTCDPNPELATETRTVIEYPDGSCTQHYFSAYPRNPSAESWSYGLPFSPSTASGTVYLSTETWTAAEDTGNILPQYLQRQCAGTKLRSNWLRYDHDTLLSGSANDGSDAHNSNRRVVETKKRSITTPPTAAGATIRVRPPLSRATSTARATTGRPSSTATSPATATARR